MKKFVVIFAIVVAPLCAMEEQQQHPFNKLSFFPNLEQRTDLELTPGKWESLSHLNMPHAVKEYVSKSHDNIIFLDKYPYNKGHLEVFITKNIVVNGADCRFNSTLMDKQVLSLIADLLKKPIQDTINTNKYRLVIPINHLIETIKLKRFKKLQKHKNIISIDVVSESTSQLQNEDIVNMKNYIYSHAAKLEDSHKKSIDDYHTIVTTYYSSTEYYSLKTFNQNKEMLSFLDFIDLKKDALKDYFKVLLKVISIELSTNGNEQELLNKNLESGEALQKFKKCCQEIQRLKNETDKQYYSPYAAPALWAGIFFIVIGSHFLPKQYSC